MASDLENLKARRSAICAELAALAPGKAGGLPDQKDAGIGHVEYRKSLVEELKSLNEVIGDGGGFGGDSPACYEVVSEGYT